MNQFSRRRALRKLVGMYGAANILGAQERIGRPAPAPLDDPVLDPVNVMDFARLAQKKLDPVAWDYLEGGSEEEESLRANMAGYRRIILRPKVLTGVGNIDTSLDLF